MSTTLKPHNSSQNVARYRCRLGRSEPATTRHALKSGSPTSEIETPLKITPVMVTGEVGRGKKLVEALRGRATVQMATDELMALTRCGEGV